MAEVPVTLSRMDWPDLGPPERDIGGADVLSKSQPRPFALFGQIYLGAVMQLARAATEYAEFRSLQINQNAHRALLARVDAARRTI